jgi:hypothetical protein
MKFNENIMQFKKGTYIKHGTNYRLVLEELGDIRFISEYWTEGEEKDVIEECSKECGCWRTIHDMKDWIEVSAKEATGKEEKWEPKHLGSYWLVSDGGNVEFRVWIGLEDDQFRLATGNCFKTEDEALKEMLKKV